MENSDDLLKFSNRSNNPILNTELEPYKVIISDDDIDIHQLTKIVLKDFTFEDRSLCFISGYSGEETKQLIASNPDTALILLDVVMETDDAGLNVIKFIREELNNPFVRIILRTGQPGQAPERHVITEYDISDYKEKTELTAQKLFTVVTSSLRTYRDLKTIDKNRKGLERIIKASSNLFEIHSFKEFTSGLLTQMISLLQLDEDSLYIQSAGLAIAKNPKNKELKIIAATGNFEKYIGKHIKDMREERIFEYIDKSISTKKSIFKDDIYIGYFETNKGLKNIIYLQGKKTLTELDRNLISIFSTNVGIAFENIHLNDEIKRYNLELEKRISEKTKELEHKNKIFMAGLEMARKVQQSIIPKENDFPKNKNMRFAYRYISLESVGGDLYDIIHIQENLYGFLIADVAGHGISAALITTMVKAIFNSLSRQYTDTSKICDKANKELCRLISNSKSFLTAYYCIIDTTTNTLYYTNSGHPPALLYSSQGNNVKRLDTKGSILGAYEDSTFEMKNLKLKKGDKILLFTDGIIEARNKSNELYGYKRLETLVSNNYHLSIDDLLDKIIQDVNLFSENRPQDDDIAMLYIEIE